MILATSDLLLQGLTHSDIQRRVRTGELFRIARGCYTDTDPRQLSVEERHLQLVGGLLHRLGEGAVLSHASAAVVHGLWVPAEALARVHIVRQVAKDSIGRRVHVHPRTEGEVVTRPLAAAGSVQVTDLDTTAVALLRTLPLPAAVAVADSALRVGLDRAGVLTRLGELRGWRGSRRALLALDFADARSESAGESWSRWLMHAHRLPPPILQHDFHTADEQWIARTDFWWPQQRLIGEFDGRIKYGRLLKPGQDISEVILAERAREVSLINLGNRMTRWTWQALDPPSTLVNQIARALRQRR